MVKRKSTNKKRNQAKKLSVSSANSIVEEPVLKNTIEETMMKEIVEKVNSVVPESDQAVAKEDEENGKETLVQDSRSIQDKLKEVINQQETVVPTVEVTINQTSNVDEESLIEIGSTILNKTELLDAAQVVDVAIEEYVNDKVEIDVEESKETFKNLADNEDVKPSVLSQAEAIIDMDTQVNVESFKLENESNETVTTTVEDDKGVSSEKVDTIGAVVESVLSNTEDVKDSFVPQTKDFKDSVVSQADDVKESVVSQTGDATVSLVYQAEEIKDSSVTQADDVKDSAHFEIKEFINNQIVETPIIETKHSMIDGINSSTTIIQDSISEFTTLPESTRTLKVVESKENLVPTNPTTVNDNSGNLIANDIIADENKDVTELKEAVIETTPDVSSLTSKVVDDVKIQIGIVTEKTDETVSNVTKDISVLIPPASTDAEVPNATNNKNKRVCQCIML